MTSWPPESIAASPAARVRCLMCRPWVAVAWRCRRGKGRDPPSLPRGPFSRSADPCHRAGSPARSRREPEALPRCAGKVSLPRSVDTRKKCEGGEWVHATSPLRRGGFHLDGLRPVPWIGSRRFPAEPCPRRSSRPRGRVRWAGNAIGFSCGVAPTRRWRRAVGTAACVEVSWYLSGSSGSWISAWCSRLTACDRLGLGGFVLAGPPVCRGTSPLDKRYGSLPRRTFYHETAKKTSRGAHCPLSGASSATRAESPQGTARATQTPGYLEARASVSLAPDGLGLHGSVPCARSNVPGGASTRDDTRSLAFTIPGCLQPGERAGRNAVSPRAHGGV